MSCEEFGQLISGYVDGELSEDQRQRLEEHLKECQACAGQLQEATEMKEELDMLKFKEPSDVELNRYWSSVYNRLERGIGWIMLSLGSIIALSCWAFFVIEEFVADPGIAAALKIGVAALITGVIVLFVSLVRERLTLRRTDKYSREVQR